VLFIRLKNPQAWFGFAALFAAIGWILFIYDLRLIRARAHDSAGPASNRLIKIVTRDQWINIAILVPGVLLCNLASFLCIRAWPNFFLVREFHVVLAIAQVLGFAGYLFYLIRYFRSLTP